MRYESCTKWFGLLMVLVFSAVVATPAAWAEPINTATVRAVVLSIEDDCIFCGTGERGCYVQVGNEPLAISLPPASGVDCIDNLEVGDCLEVTGRVLGNESLSPGFGVTFLNIEATTWGELTADYCDE